MSLQERAKSYAGVLPDQSEEALLQLVAARNLQRSEVISWLDSTDLDTANDGVMRLLPTLHPRIERMGVNHPEVDRIRGIYRHTLYRNRMIMHRGIQILTALRKEGVPSLLLKGAAILTAPGVNLGTRPMSDFDILVPEEVDLHTVERIIRESDFPRPELRTRSQGTLSFYDKNGLEYDVQCKIKHTNGFAGASQVFWDDSRDVVFRDELVSVQSPEHFAFHTMIHGMRYNVVSPVRWIADVLQLKESHPNLDWEKVAQTAVFFRCQDPVIEGLEYLLRVGFVGPEVQPAIQILEDSSYCSFDRRYFRNAALSSEKETRTQRLRRLLDEFSRQCAFEKRRRSPLRLVHFLRDRIGGKSLLNGFKRFALDERD